MKKKRLDIGCGTSKKYGFIGVDIIGFEEVDVIHDLNKFPYPFASSEIDEIWMDNVLEHLDNPIGVIDEIYRICKNGSDVTISVPYFRSYFSVIDPTHKNFFGVNWFNYFEPSHELHKRYQYSQSKFRIKEVKFDREWKGRMNFLHRMLTSLAERYPGAYESKLSHIFPLNSITFYLQCIK